MVAVVPCSARTGQTQTTGGNLTCSTLTAEIAAPTDTIYISRVSRTPTSTSVVLGQDPICPAVLVAWDLCQQQPPSHRPHIPPPPPGPLAPSPLKLISSPSCCVLQYYEDEGDSEMSGAHPDEEVAVTKRGRAVKLPAKYKAEVRSPLSHHQSILAHHPSCWKSPAHIFAKAAPMPDAN